MFKEQIKALKRRLAWFATRIFTSLASMFSLPYTYNIGKALGSTAYTVLMHHRKIALESLSVAFPQKSLAEKKEIARNFFIFMVQSSFELLHFLKNPGQLDNVRIEGRRYLDEALSYKKGVIILTAHLGNFPLLSLKLAKEGYSVYFVTRPMRDEKASDYIHKLRTDAGVKTIFSYPRKKCITEIIRALGNDEIVIMQMDQNFGTGGVWVKFFGTLAATPVGPIVLALRTKAMVLPAYIYRESEGKHCIRIFPSESLILTPDSDETILLNTIRFTRIIEGWIREFSSQWGWIHRRWKSRPSEQMKDLKFKIEK
jgi:KDO2-lipid IV(A) lauroyltransferase